MHIDDFVDELWMTRLDCDSLRTEFEKWFVDRYDQWDVLDMCSRHGYEEKDFFFDFVFKHRRDDEWLAQHGLFHVTPWGDRGYFVEFGDNPLYGEYSSETDQGFPILAVKNDIDRINVISRKDDGYMYGVNYDPDYGVWAQGAYQIKDLEQAIEKCPGELLWVNKEGHEVKTDN